MKTIYDLNKNKSALLGSAPHLEDIPSIIDSTPACMMRANGGLYCKQDKIHLDRSSGDTHNTPPMPKDVFQLERIGRGLGVRLSSLKPAPAPAPAPSPSPASAPAPAPAPAE